MRRVVATAVAASLALAFAAPVLAAERPLGLPDPARTPGAVNPRVTQATIHSTICVSGYTSTIRPPESYTESLKFRQLDGGYNLRGDTRASHYEEDHLIPLELGGSPTSVKNLWPEPRDVLWGASRKDVLENRMHELVCDGAVTLAAARQVFRSNWISGYRRYVAS